MIDERFVFIALALNIIGSISYVWETLKGRAKPNRVTWFLWALAPMIAFAAEISEGVRLVSLMTFAVGFGPLLVFIASFVNKKAYWQLGKLDYVCGGLSLLALILWGVTREGNIAIALAIAADGLAAVPTVVKSYREPETESAWVFLLAAISAVITLLTIKDWNFAHYGFPIYILAICTILTLLITLKWRPPLTKVSEDTAE